MALTKEVVLDRIEVTEESYVQVRRATYIVEDGKRIAGPEYHRVSYAPGTKVVHEDAKVQAVCGAVWTPSVVAAWRPKKPGHE